MKRASQTAGAQRQAKWDALIKRARKAARDGRVQFVFLFLFLTFITWATLATQWVVGRNNYLENLKIYLSTTRGNRDIENYLSTTKGNSDSVETPPRGTINSRTPLMSGAWRWLKLLGLYGSTALDSNAFASMAAYNWRHGTLAPRATWAFRIGKEPYSPRAVWVAKIPKSKRRLARWAGRLSIYKPEPGGVHAISRHTQAPGMGDPLGPNKGWGRALAAWMFATLVNQWRRDRGARKISTGLGTRSGFMVKGRIEAGHNVPTLRAGGGVSRSSVVKRDLFAKNQAELVPVALCDWGSWYGTEAVKRATNEIETNIGGSVASSTRHNYEGHFHKWAVFRGVNGKDPYISTCDEKFMEEEDSVLSYVALSVGPLGKEVSTMVTHLSAIGFFHRVKIGFNPLSKMSMVQLMLKCLKRASGPTNRKLPFTIEDIRSLKGMLNLRDADQACLWACVLTGWFFMLRMSEFLVTNSKHTPPGRHPILMEDVQPLCQGSPTVWGDHVDEISVHISGSKTDWTNQGCVRSHTMVSQESPNSDICVVRAYVELSGSTRRNSAKT